MNTTSAILDSSAPPTVWTPICRRSDLEPGWGEAALVGGQQVAVFLLPDGRIAAVSNADPATGAFVMSRGIVGSRGDRATIASPLHKDVFDLETGECYTKPGALSLPVWRVREADGSISVAPARALVAASHGTSDLDGRRAVAALVDAVRAARGELTVADAHVDVQQPDVPSVLAGLSPESSATIVPLLLSTGYHVHVDLAEAAGDSDREVTVTRALGPDQRLVTVLARRLREAGLRTDDAVVLAAAGSSDERAVEDCRITGEMLSAELGRPVTTSFISAAQPRVADAVADVRASTRGRVVVSTYLLAPGYFADLAARAGADVTTAPLLTADPPVPPELVQIVVDRYDRPTDVVH